MGNRHSWMAGYDPGLAFYLWHPGSKCAWPGLDCDVCGTGDRREISIIYNSCKLYCELFCLIF